MDSSDIHPDVIRPMGPYVLVSVEPRGEKTRGGLYRPNQDVGREHVMEGVGRVVRVGPGQLTDKGVTLTPPVEPGDRITFRRFLKDAIPLKKVEDVEHCLLHMNDITMKVGDDVDLAVM